MESGNSCRHPKNHCFAKPCDWNISRSGTKEPFACFALSVALLIGLVCRSVFGFWLADPLVGLIIVVFLFNEGRELLFGDGNEEG